jgi:predicted nucleic acid-binding protein
MTVVFADTFYFLALVNPRERRHALAVEYSRNSSVSLLTTAWVLTEVGNALSKGVNREIFLRLLDDLSASAENELVPPSEEFFDAGIQLFRQRPDKSWSLTDCVSFVVMEQRGVTEALTGDHHFEQAGYVALLK